MQQTHWLDSPFEKDIYQASSIHSSFKYHIDYWLIGKEDGYVDAKRIIPIMFLALFIIVAWFFFFVANEMEFFSHLLTANMLHFETRFDFIFWRLNSFFAKRLLHIFCFWAFFIYCVFLFRITLPFFSISTPRTF